MFAVSSASRPGIGLLVSGGKNMNEIARKLRKKGFNVSRKSMLEALEIMRLFREALLELYSEEGKDSTEELMIELLDLCREEDSKYQIL